MIPPGPAMSITMLQPSYWLEVCCNNVYSQIKHVNVWRAPQLCSDTPPAQTCLSVFVISLFRSVPRNSSEYLVYSFLAELYNSFALKMKKKIA